MTDDALLRPRPIDLPTSLALDGPIDAEAADGAKIFAAPTDPADWPRWRERLHEWRGAALERWPHTGAAYTRAPTRWTRGCFSVALVWLWDERLFDHAANRFDVDGFLETTADFGGFDAVVLWQAYPVVGIDERTQFDLYCDVPGIGEVVAAFQAHGVRVFVDYNPWDTASGDAARHPALVAALVAQLGADGVFLDTMREGGEELRRALAALNPPPVLEGESKVSLERVADHQLSWAQWFADSDAPGVMRARWFERRHMLHHTRRWNRDHSAELQSAWMNGAGVLVWDAVFGTWVGWNERDRSTLRSMVRAQRALVDVLTDGEWTPLLHAPPAALEAGVYVSSFEHGDVALWTAINRGDADYRGPVLGAHHGDDRSWFDVTAGVALPAPPSDVTVPARGIAGVVAVRGAVPPWLSELVAEAATDPHATDASFPERTPRRLVPATAPIRPAEEPPRSGMRAGTVVVDAGQHSVTVTYRLRETGMYDGAPFVEAWKPLPPLLHSEVAESHTVTTGRVGVAAREVTNDEFREFVDATGYAPLVTHRFAARSRAAGPGPGGSEPMTYVDLADARAYAAWHGARLPTEFEWQLAALATGFQRLEPAVWNLTESVHSDGATRFVILKGGSAYEPGSSPVVVDGVDHALVAPGIDWYFDGGRRDPSFNAKLLVAGLGVGRSSRIGFRIAWDLEERPASEPAEEPTREGPGEGPGEVPGAVTDG